MAEFDAPRFDDFVLTRMRETTLPSISALAVRDGRVVYSHAFGYRDAEAALPPTERTLYGVGSITKTFTSLAVGKLVEEGKMDFHDPITKHLPLDEKVFGGIEVSHLLSHSSGIPGLGYGEVLIGSALGDFQGWLPVSTVEDMSAFMDHADEWKTAQPGERLHYLNEGFFLLGEAVAQTSGVSFEKFLKENVLKPMKMNRSFFSKAEMDADPDRSVPYLIKDGRLVPSVFPYGCGAGGGLITSASDLSHLVMTLLSDGEFEGRPVIDKRILGEIEMPRVRWPVQRYGGDAYGYGMMITPNFFGRRVIGHGGDILVYTADLKCSPEAGVGSIVMANAAGYSTSTLNSFALTLLLEEDPEQLPALKSESLLRKLEGTYKAYKGTISAQVKRADSFLILSGYDIGQNIVLVPVEHDKNSATFYTLIAGARLDVKFTFGDSGVELFYERYRYRMVGPPP